MIATTSSSEIPTRLPARFRTSLTFSDGKPIRSSVSRPSFVFFSESASSMPTMQMLVALSMVAITSGVKPGRRVDDDVVEHPAQRRVDLAQELDRDDGGVIGPARRDQHLDAADECVIRKPSSFSSSSEPPVRTRSKIVCSGRQAHAEPDVAELQVEVDEGDALAELGERDREARRGQRLAGAALRPEHADQRCAGERRRPRRCRPCGRPPSGARTAPRRS